MKKISFTIMLIVFSLILIGCQTNDQNTYINSSLNNTTMEIQTVFSENESIPSKYTCDGDNINPQINVTDLPENTKSVVLIVDDPDAPTGTFVHWVAFNIPPQDGQVIINEGEKPQCIEGSNDFGNVGYGGPCPPSGNHRYFFKAYALDTELDLSEGASKEDVESSMENNVLDSAQIIGMYSRE